MADKTVRSKIDHDHSLVFLAVKPYPKDATENMFGPDASYFNQSNLTMGSNFLKENVGEEYGAFSYGYFSQEAYLAFGRQIFSKFPDTVYVNKKPVKLPPKDKLYNLLIVPQLERIQQSILKGT